MSTNTDIYAQLLNVTMGYTADGRPRGAPLKIPSSDLVLGQLTLILTALFRDIENQAPGVMSDDRLRTALILVLMRWLKLINVFTGVRLSRIARRVGPTTH